MGWSLQGLSTITRCPRTKRQDGANGQVLFDANDRLCLDGQYLVVVNGSYGADDRRVLRANGNANGLHLQNAAAEVELENVGGNYSVKLRGSVGK